MPAGTITLSNNSDAVTGSGTSFTTELKVGDFVVSTVGGVAYTLGVKSIESDTALTLVEKFTGPSTTGLSWTPIPYGTMTAITAQLAAQVTYALRGFNLDKANWQNILTGDGDVTIILPDGTSWTGPAWSSISGLVAGKADKTSLDLYAKKGANIDITSLAGLTTSLSVSQGGTGGSTRESANASLGNQSMRIGDATITTSGGKVVRIEGIIGAQQPVGAFNLNQGWYTHYYGFTLPGSFSNALTSCTMTVVSARGDQQTAEYPAIVRCTRDKNGGGTSTNQITVAITTPFTGWYPYFNFSAVGY